jgi:hypothetical protein
MKRYTRRILANAILGLAICAAFTACNTMAPPPLYTQEELKAICERRGGWWRGNLISGYCEYELASRIQAP